MGFECLRREISEPKEQSRNVSFQDFDNPSKRFRSIASEAGNAQITASYFRTMDRYLIESPHEPGDCKKVVKNVYAQGYLYNCDWGCKGGVHKAWVIIEAESESRALWVVPPMLRANAKAIKIVKFEPEMVKDWEE